MNNYLKYWRTVRMYTCEKHGLSYPDLEMLLFLFDEGRFRRNHFRKFEKVFSWDKNRFDRLLTEGWIVNLNKNIRGPVKGLYEVSPNTKRMIRTLYGVLSGEIIQEIDPALRTNNSYMKRRRMKQIELMNQERQQRRGQV